MTCKFYLKESDAETQLIMLKIYDSQFQGGRFYYSTKERIKTSEWDEKNGKVKGGKDYLNSRLSLIKSEAERFISLNREVLTKEALKEHLDNLRPKEVPVIKKPTMLEEWNDHLINIKGSVALRTYWNYVNAYNCFDAFLKEKKLAYLTPEEFNFRHYQAYQVYLKKSYAPNTVAKRTKIFKMFVKYLEKMRVKIDMSLDDIKFKETSGIKIYLTEDELDKIENLMMIGSIDHARDLFLLQCCTGLRISDLFRVDQNIKGDKIVLETQKVAGNVVEIPITLRVEKILQKYKNKLPVMAEQTYREFIKEIYKRIDKEATIQVRVGGKFENRFVWQEISSHDAVRTFVTLSAEKGMTIPEIASIVGKSVSVLLKNYLVSNRKVAQESMIAAWAK
jgi:hypothetical protein